MGNLIVKVLVICISLCCCHGVAQSQEGAEKYLSDYLLKYDDFYQEFALMYRGETFAVRKKGQEVREWLRSVEGVVVESASRNIFYAAQKSVDLTGLKNPSIMEELTIGGKLFSKQYGTVGNTGRVEPTSWGVPSDANPAPKLIPCIQPHGLALLRDLELIGRQTEMRKCVPIFLTNKHFVEEMDLEKGGVRGVWITPNTFYQCTIDFSPDDHHLPVKVVWEVVGDPASGIAKCTTITKWKKDGDLHVPIKIEISSRLGEGRSEVRHEFFFLKKERFEKEMKEITPDFANALGTAWIDRFTGWFENEP